MKCFSVYLEYEKKNIFRTLVAGSGIGKEAEVTVDGERAESLVVGRRVLDGVQDFHVPDVVDVEGFFQAHHEPGPVQLDGQDRLGIRIVAYFSALLEMAHLKGT